MTRDDVIDILTVVAAADRRTVGQSDVEVWQAVMGDCDKQLALQAVRNHLRERPGVWLEPGHVVEGVRAIRRDVIEREPDAMRDARQKALAAKAAEDAAELAERKGIPTGRQYVRKSITGVNPLTVKCPWCRAGLGARCTIPGTQPPQLLEEHPPMRAGFHPSRIEAAQNPRVNA